MVALYYFCRDWRANLFVFAEDATPTADSLLGVKSEMTARPWPNKSPEPTAVGAVSYAVAVHAAGRRWLSFLH